jgi:putative ABC transport system substrate-binding protein
MQRREFIAGLGGAAVAWPVAARAQQGDRVRRIGVLMPGDENDPAQKTYFSALTQALADLGWTDGRNVRMDPRWGGGDANRIRALAQELVALQPDIIVTPGTLVTAALQRETRTIPIVFAGVAEPVASGILPRLNRPSENVTGFAKYEPTMGGKGLDLLSEIIVLTVAFRFMAQWFSRVTTATRNVPWNAVCPPHAMALLAWRGYGSSFHPGADYDAQGKLISHAWLVVGTIVVGVAD